MLIELKSNGYVVATATYRPNNGSRIESILAGRSSWLVKFTEKVHTFLRIRNRSIDQGSLQISTSVDDGCMNTYHTTISALTKRTREKEGDGENVYP